MTAQRLNWMVAKVATVMTAAALAMPLAAQSANQNPAANAPAATQQTTPATPKHVIVVSLEDHKLALLEDGQVKKVYTVAVGKPSTPSPVGTFTIARRVKNPQYTHDGHVVPAGPNNPVGTRWMGLSIPGYGIHGTNEPNSIGKAASHGCIRMARKDLEELFPMVAVGDTVEIIGERNEETARVFGDAPILPGTAQPSAPTVLAANQQLTVRQLPIAPPIAAQRADNAAALPSMFTPVAAASLSVAGSL